MISNGLVLNHFQLNGKSFNMENDMSIDNVSPQEWDAYNRRRIQAMKDPNNYNKEGMTDQESLNALDTKMETDISENNKKFNHVIDHIANVANQIKDNVNNPTHYNTGSVECIDAIEAMLTPDEYIGYLRGNSMKYRWRMRYKGKPIEDLQKAEWYENRLLNFLKENEGVLGS